MTILEDGDPFLFGLLKLLVIFGVYKTNTILSKTARFQKNHM